MVVQCDAKWAQRHATRTAAILACNEGGIGVDAMGLRLASSPATVRGGAEVFRATAWRATAASEGEDASDIVGDGDDDDGGDDERL